jgi:hypothetical protein
VQKYFCLILLGGERGFPPHSKPFRKGENLMARQKKLSEIIEKADQRLTALRAIDPKLDLGGGLTLTAFAAQVSAARAALDAYNNLLTQVDAAYNTFQSSEGSVNEFSQRMLAGVGSRYGKDSTQYEQAGGKRKSERKKYTRKAVAA